MEYKFALVALTLALLEGTHANLSQRIKTAEPEIYKTLGITGPGYFFFGLFWFAPTYRRFLTSHKFASVLSGHPELVRLGEVELILWYVMWLSVALAVIL
jgi:hypothetical protein